MTDYYARARKYLPPRSTNIDDGPAEDVWAGVCFAADEERLRMAEQLTDMFENLANQEGIPDTWDPATIAPPDNLQPADITAWEF